MDNVEWLEQRVCAVCGKVFWPPDPGSWVYKREKWNTKKFKYRTIYFCSWGCLRKYERGYEIRPDYSPIEHS